MIRLDVIRGHVRNMLKDSNPAPPGFAVPGYTLDEAISRNMQLIAGSLGMPLTWDTTFATLVVGTEDYTVDKDFDFHSIALFRLGTSGMLVEKVSAEYLERHRQGNVSGNGMPQLCTVLEQPDSAGDYRSLTVRVWPKPALAESLQALYAQFPIPVSADADGIPMSELGGRATELMSAVELLAGMHADDCTRLRIDKGVIPKWEKSLAQAMEDEQIRFAALQRGRQMNRSTS